MAAAAVKLRLRARFILALVAVALPALLAAAWYASRAVEAIRTDLGRAYARDITLLKRERIVAPVSRDLALSIRLSESQLLRDWLLHEDDAQRRDAAFRELEGYRGQFHGNSVFVISALSDHYWFNDPKAAPSMAPRYRIDRADPANAWYEATLAMPTRYNVNVSQDTHLMVANVWLNVLVLDGERRLGLAGTGVELTRFLQDFILDAGPGVTPLIVNADGAILAHPDPARISAHSATRAVQPEHTLWALLPDPAGQAAARAALQRAAASPGTAEPLRLVIDGKDAWFAASYIPELQWHVISVVDLNLAEVLDRRQLLQLGLVLAGLLLLATLGFGWLVNRLIARPLFALKASAEALAAGDPATALPPARADEVGDLTRAFGIMAAQVRRQTEELEGTVRARTSELVAAHATLAATHARLADSIAYASRLQQAILPRRQLEAALPGRQFVLWQPRDGVGGDFWLFQQGADGWLLGVVDCAGHGVPGALMTMLGHAAFEQAISAVGPSDPAAILKRADTLLRGMLEIDERSSGTATSMEAGLVWCDCGTATLTFAGARIALLGSDGTTLQQHPGGRRALGERRVGEYANQVLPASPAQLWLLCTDGLLDQNGCADDFGFGSKRLGAWLQAAAAASAEQPEAPLDGLAAELDGVLRAWRGPVEQRDDITVLGFRVTPPAAARGTLPLPGSSSGS